MTLGSFLVFLPFSFSLTLINYNSSISLLFFFSFPFHSLALAAIGEKEWFFYVPRDRKYRNGDRPNRVTTSGYWKATGADRMIRTEDFRSIGLKKTLVFYSGKAPKGIRTSWIMNEYRLPHHDTERYQKVCNLFLHDFAFSFILTTGVWWNWGVLNSLKNIKKKYIFVGVWFLFGVSFNNNLQEGIYEFLVCFVHTHITDRSLTVLLGYFFLNVFSWTTWSALNSPKFSEGERKGSQILLLKSVWF